MAQPEQRQSRPIGSGSMTVSRLLMFIAFACALIAALTEAFSEIDIGPALAWLFGAFAAWFLAQTGI